MANGFAIRISAVDGATKQIDLINKRLQALQAPVVKLKASLAKLADTSGLNKIAGAFRGLAGYARSLVGQVSSLLPGMAALTGAGTIAGMAALVTRFGDFGAELGNTSRRIGSTASSLHTLQGAARLAGADASSMASGLQTLDDTMQDAVAGRAPDMLRMFNALGVSIHASSFGAKSAEAILPQLADKIAGIRNPAIQAQVATRLFGGAAERLLPFLRKGSAGIAELRQQAVLYGVVNDEGVKKANEMREAQTRVAMAFEGLGNSIAQHVSPVLTPLLTDFSLWIAKNREWIATGIGEQVRRFGDWLRAIDWKQVTERASSFWDTLTKISASFGGIVTITEVLIGLWASSKFLGAVAALTRMGVALGPLAGVLGGLGVAAFLGAMDGEREREDKERAARGEGPGPTLGQRLKRWLQSQGMQFEGDPLPPGSAPISAPGSEQAGRAQQAYDFFRSKGWTHEQASGLVAQIDRESNFNPNAVHDGGIGFGILGWNRSRLEALGRFIGRDPRTATYAEQLAFMHQEATEGAEKANGDRVRAATSAAQAGAAASRYLVRPADEAGEAARRALMAEQYGTRFQGLPPPPPAPSPPPVVNPVAAPTPGPQSSLTGSATLNIAFANQPAGMTVDANTTGMFGAPNIVMGMPSYAG